MDVTSEREIWALLVLSQSLLGEVSPNLRAVTARIDADHIHFDAYFDSTPSDDELECMSEVDLGLGSAFGEGEVSYSVFVLPSPAKVPKDVHWAYHRYEGFPHSRPQPPPDPTGQRVMLNEGRQGKYVLGHPNFVPRYGGGVLTHPDPQALLDEHAGTGQIIRERREEVQPENVAPETIVQPGGCLGFGRRK